MDTVTIIRDAFDPLVEAVGPLAALGLAVGAALYGLRLGWGFFRDLADDRAANSGDHKGRFYGAHDSRKP